MKQSIILSGQPVEYILRRSLRSRSIRISITADGELRMTVPVRGTVATGEAFMHSKARWVLDRLEKMRSEVGMVIRVRRDEVGPSTNKARDLVIRRLQHFNQFYGFRYNKITIRNQKSRWGSCSKKGNLNFSYKLAVLPPHLADYIVVHELCHLGELNHSKNFWDLVAKTMPHWKEYRKELGKIRIVFV